MSKKIEQYVFRSDGDGHHYYIPLSRAEEFSYWLESFNEESDESLFNDFLCDDPASYVFSIPPDKLIRESDLEE